MSFRFGKKIKLMPGLYINFSKSGTSTTFKLGDVSWSLREFLPVTGVSLISGSASCCPLLRAAIDGVADELGLTRSEVLEHLARSESLNADELKEIVGKS